jgi:putative nucleotidyltransferase with HDIG domain
MTQLQILWRLVEKQYAQSPFHPDVWVSWTYPNHVKVVAEIAQELAQKYGANPETAVAGALLHEIGYTVTYRHDPDFEPKNRALIDQLLEQAGYMDEEAEFIWQEIIACHNCRSRLPTTVEGQVMTTADALAHLTTEFYPYFCWHHLGKETYPEFKAWLQEKIHRDYYTKIFFEEERARATEDYESLKRLFWK